MKRLLLLTVSVLLLFTACLPVRDPLPEREELDYEKLKDGVYVDYDRSKFENIAAPKRYYAEYVTIEDNDIIPFFSAKPAIYTEIVHEKHRKRVFTNGSENGYCNCWDSTVFYNKEHCNDLSVMFEHFYAIRYEPSVKELDFMPLSELNERFADDIHRFVPDFRIHNLFAITAEEFADAAAERDPPEPERGWSEPKDFYYIRARQYVDDIPLFAGVSVMNETLIYDGSQIEACYSEDGIEGFIAWGLYSVVEEAPIDGTFIDLRGAEQIIRDEYELIYPYDDMILFECDLVYVAVSEGGRIVLTPVWEFYEDLFAIFGPHTNEYFSNPRIRVNAYTGELMRCN